MSDAKRITWGKPRRPSDADRDALRDDLLAQARAVRGDGWADYRTQWPAGQVAVVAYVLGDAEVLADLEETEGTVLSRYAADLFGFVGGRKDNESGLVKTQAWFDSVRKALDH
ncbi:hypothetical protein [Nocardia rhizosphaerihabitans]|uniref:Uncharacterized protein n=1 Tax=Nocardia rhizosphaerihabitans TaxID=1691570 RepID=A0ABQ2K9I4_9NOCA|nr:hypothetical protein [Nocardia rhizosphaerihabitans]GGN76878.1 hypothetical protein GCM10011610_22790 [Nocardia rhizosphaerihabitans]